MYLTNFATKIRKNLNSNPDLRNIHNYKTTKPNSSHFSSQFIQKLST